MDNPSRLIDRTGKNRVVLSIGCSCHDFIHHVHVVSRRLDALMADKEVLHHG